MGLAFEQLPERPVRAHRFFELDRRFVDVALPGRKLRLSYVEAGSGKPLVLLHGLMTSAYSFRYVVPALAERYRVVVPDLPGSGHSDAPVDFDMHPRSVAALLSAFQQALGLGQAYWVGNSLGGYLALWFAVLHPEKVERLVVMHAPGFPELRLEVLHAALGLPIAPFLVRWVTRGAERFAAKNIHYRDMGLLSREEASEYGAIFKDASRTHLFYRVLKESMDPEAMRELLAALPEARARLPKTLLLWSREDALVPPSYGPRYQALLPSARLQWVDDSSHFLQVDSPDETVRALLEFGAE